LSASLIRESFAGWSGITSALATFCRLVELALVVGQLLEPDRAEAAGSPSQHRSGRGCPHRDDAHPIQQAVERVLAAASDEDEGVTLADDGWWA
jgi:hypothetical protein